GVRTADTITIGSSMVQSSTNQFATKQIARDNPALHFVGTFVDFADLGIAVDRLQRELATRFFQLAHEAIGTTYLDSVACNIHGKTASGYLGHGSLDFGLPFLVVTQPGLDVQVAGAFDAQRMLGKNELRMLEGRQVLTEYLALAAVIDSKVHRSLGHSDANGTDAHAPEHQCAQCRAQTAANMADYMVIRYEYVIDVHIGGQLCVVAHLEVRLANGYTRRMHVHAEHRQLVPGTA